MKILVRTSKMQTTKFISIFLIILLSVIAKHSAYAQLKITYADDKGECRMKPKDIKPIIPAKNPFFNTHIWIDETKTELAELSSEKTLQIIQEACLRHHTKIRLSITPKGVPNPKDLNFYVAELFNLMNRLYFYDVNYYSYRLEFEDLFIKNFKKYGINSEFNFLLADYTFICLMEGGDWGASVNLEIVKLIHKEEIELPGVKGYMDDGHFTPAVPFR